MQRPMTLLLAAGTALCLAGGARAAMPAAKAGQEHLMQLFLASLAADRCGFAINSRQADALEAATTKLQANLRLDAEGAEALQSEADIAFTRYGADACDRGGELARVFRQTIEDLAKP